MMIVSYYTDNGSYPEEKKIFEASLDRVGMNHNILKHDDQGDWYANTRMKPRFIQEMRKTYEGPILYVDVDAFIHKNCEEYFDQLGTLDVDFGAHWFQGPAKGHDQTDVRDEGWWMLSGTLFIGDTPGARRLLDTWCYMNDVLFQQGVVEGGGQKNLWFLTTCMTDLDVARLHGRFCYVFDKAWAYPSEEPCVIEHTIASRDHRGGEHRRTRSRERRIIQLKKSIETGEPAPHPRGTEHERARMTQLDELTNQRKLAARGVSAAKKAYQSACSREKAIREELGL